MQLRINQSCAGVVHKAGLRPVTKLLLLKLILTALAHTTDGFGQLLQAAAAAFG